jgi:hypothetical protein
MATIRGEQGAVQFDAAGSSNATIVGTRSWSLSTTKAVLDTTTQGQTSTTVVGGLIGGSGSVELVYDKSAAGQSAFMAEAIRANDPATATFELFLTGTTSGSDSISFAGLVENMELGSTVGDLVTVNCSFTVNGDMTSDA